MKADMDKIIREEARLLILKGLFCERSETLSSAMIERLLYSYGIRRDRDFVHNELAWMEDQGAVTLKRVDSVLIAALTERGARHLDRSFSLSGIKRPNRPSIKDEVKDAQGRTWTFNGN
ncbi:VpaChn25_0724 family phage protein [Bartonella sp. CB60]|uniref:VpaChn25_0724 family phage protein n=1 Tax=Bartonella sp. CB60 TaxID=3113619 RepID=UPI00300DF26F